MPAAYELR